jgi:hypothetical protein
MLVFEVSCEYQLQLVLSYCGVGYWKKYLNILSYSKNFMEIQFICFERFGIKNESG